MINFLSRFAADTGPVVHVSPLPVFNIGGFTITNSIFYGWVCALLLIVVLVSVARRVTVKPQGGLTQFVEAGVDFVTNLVEGAFDDKKIGRKYVPYFVTVFFIILVNNWLGLVPIVGEGFKVGENPLLRPLTGDLNATFAIAVVTMIMVYTASVREAGSLLKYLRHFFVGSPLNPLFFLIGLVEMLTDLIRVVSLSLRLFLNVAIGEIVIAIFAYLGHLALPFLGIVGSFLFALPFTLLEIGVAALQAYIFTILGTMYLAIAVNGVNAHNHDDLTEDAVPETIGSSASRAVS